MMKRHIPAYDLVTLEYTMRECRLNGWLEHMTPIISQYLIAVIRSSQ